MRKWPPPRVGIAGRVVAWQIGLLTVLVLAGFAAAVGLAQRSAHRAAEHEVLALGRSVAALPSVQDALGRPDASALLQPLAEAVRRSSGVDFVVVMTPAGIRLSHPTPSLLGQPFQGHIAGAQAGGTDVETYTGTLGPSLRAVVPVRRAGAIVGLVAVGIGTATVGDQAREQLPLVVIGATVALCIAVLGSWLLGRSLRRQTLGLGPQELARIFQSHEAVLHSVREGLLVVDDRCRLQLINDEACRLLGLGPGDVGRPVTELPVGGTVGRLLASSRPAQDESHTAKGRVLLVSQATAAAAGRHAGTVMTLRDRTEMLALTGERDQLRSFADSLAAVAHEAANRLHTVVSLIELGRPEEAVGLATRQIEASQRLTDRLLDAADGEPELVALLVAQSARAAEFGVELIVGAVDVGTGTGVDVAELLTVVGNLVDNAVDAAAGGAGARVEVEVAASAEAVTIVVTDSGPGLPPADLDHAFEFGWSTKSDAPVQGRGLGLALVRDAVERQGGTIDVEAPPSGGARFVVRFPVRMVVP